MQLLHFHYYLRLNKSNGNFTAVEKKNNVYFTLIIIGFHNTNMQMGEYYENEHGRF